MRSAQEVFSSFVLVSVGIKKQCRSRLPKLPKDRLCSPDKGPKYPRTLQLGPFPPCPNFNHTIVGSGQYHICPSPPPSQLQTLQHSPAEYRSFQAFLSLSQTPTNNHPRYPALAVVIIPLGSITLPKHPVAPSNEAQRYSSVPPAFRLHITNSR